MKKIVLIALIAPLLFSCSSELIESPKAIASETFYNTLAEVQAAAAAPIAPVAYSTGPYGREWVCMLECMSDIVNGRGSWEPNSRYNGLDATNQTRSQGVWNQFYVGIRNCNIGIERIPKGNTLTEEMKNQYVGELKFWRALFYFDMTRVYGGVPIRTEANMKDLSCPKSSQADVFKLIKEDLTFAVTNLPASSRLLGVPIKASAQALLAHVYLQLKDYAGAKALLADVVNSKKFSLVPLATSADFDKVFGPDIVTSTEEILSFKHERADNKGWQTSMMCCHGTPLVRGKKMHGAGGWYGFYTQTNAPHMAFGAWNRNDFRFQYNFVQFNLGIGTDTWLVAKFCDPDAPNGDGAGNDYPRIRYSDVLGWYAEAIVKTTGPNEEAMEMINTLHRRAYGYNPSSPSAVDYKLTDYNTVDKFMDLVVKEMGYETIMEGKRWLELQRWGIAKPQIKAMKGVDVLDIAYLWPIPNSEFNYNKEMNPTNDQNPGY